MKENKRSVKNIDKSSPTDINYTPNFTVNYLKYKRFSEIVKSKGMSNSFVIRQFMDRVIANNDPQISLDL